MKRVNLTPVLELGTNKILYYIDKNSNTKYYPEDKEGVTVQCPEGFIFINEKDEIIDARSISLKPKYPQYPKTYEECCKIFQYNKNLKVYPPFDVDIPNYNALHLFDLLDDLRKLLICRDAYQKIAGEQMGLGKSWKPDWSTTHEIKYVIEVYRNNVRKNSQSYFNTTLAFPTIEMRDIFYENFKKLIENCKELL